MSVDRSVGGESGVPIRRAATVVLLRDTDDGLQTWLMRRVPKMAFAAGMSVFPGGAVDPSDAGVAASLLADPVAADAAEAAAGQLGSTPHDVASLMCAAIRETFEEVGLLLSRPAVVLPAEDRLAVERREADFGELLARHDARLDLGSVRPWARWITPEGESRRYDTYFFVAQLPPDGVAEAVTTEASHADWIGVHQALEEYRQGSRPMLPPTISTLTEIGRYAGAQEVLAAAAERVIRPVEPIFVRDETGALSVDLGNGTLIPLPADFVSASGKRL